MALKWSAFQRGLSLLVVGWMVAIGGGFQVGRVVAAMEVPAGGLVLCYGNSFVERLFEHGEWEAWVQLANVGKGIRFRSLAWTGDEVGHRLRPEGYEEHQRALLREWPASVVVVGFGMNESFGGEAGLAEFRAQLRAYLDQLARLHPGARWVLLAPTAVESGFSGQDSTARNRDVERYARAIAEEAHRRSAEFIDCYSASRAGYSRGGAKWTENGLHLNALGLREMARICAGAFVRESELSQISAQHVAEVSQAVSQKNHFVAEVVRPKNADLYYGVRKRPEENAAEIPRYFRMIERTESVVYELARTPGRRFSSLPTPWLPPMETGKGHDDGPSTGVIRRPPDQHAEFQVAKGFAVNLFASEEEFPVLRNPVQITFDARGRLWVVTMPSFPHTVPGRPPEDRLIVLEDTDRDGRADRCVTFAEGLDALDGVAFCEDGVIVSEQPRLWLMRDENGDGKADFKRELLRGIDVTDSHHGGMIASDPMGHLLFCDGVFHRSQIETPFGVVRGIDSTTYRLAPRTGRVEVEWQSITPNPWKITFDRTGNIFQMYGDGLVLDGLALTWTPLAIYHPFAHAKTLGYGKGSAAASISSPNFPDGYQQGMASASLLGSYAVSLTRFDFGQGLVRGEGRIDVLASTNAAFRPADLAFGMDGALYVSDFCSAIIGHAQHPMRDPHWDHDHGRIWRIVHTGKPLVNEWPKIEGAGVQDLLALLTHPHDLVRHHTRIELRKSGSEAVRALDGWVARLDRMSSGFDQAALEALWVFEGFGEARPALLTELSQSRSPLHRAASIQLGRFQVDRLADFSNRLRLMALDRHPRVQMEVVDAVAHLRPKMPGLDHVLQDLTPASPDVARMLEDLKFGTAPAKGRSVPVLEIPNESSVNSWLWRGPNGGKFSPLTEGGRPVGSGGNGTYRTIIESQGGQAAVLAVQHGYLDISLNGVQILSFDSMWSRDQQVSMDLKAGRNVLDVTFRNLRGKRPDVFLFSPTGEPFRGVRVVEGDEALARANSDLESESTELGRVFRVHAVPFKMQFSPSEIRVVAGEQVRLIFENPDVMIHNLLVVSPGADSEVGLLAELLAARSDGYARGYVPDSGKVLWATPLVHPKKSAELHFKAPSQRGRYPYMCTFPGHWRLMRGTMVVD